MGILRTDRVSGLGGADAIKGSVKFTSGGALDIDLDGTSIGTSNFTIEAWVFWFGNASHQFTGSSSNNFNFYIADDDGDLKFYNGSSTFDFDASPVRANEWTHVALVREGTSTNTTKVYVNGVNTNNVTLNTSFSFDRLLSGINYLDGSRGYGNGYTSNLRFTLDAVYTSAFTPPNREFTVLDNTIVLCCQSPGNILQEATGKTIVVFKHGVNQGDPVASHFTPNSPVGFSTTTDVGTQFGSTFDGVTTFDSQAYMVPPGGNTRERNRGRGIIAGGCTPTISEISFFNIQSQGNSSDFGHLHSDIFGNQMCSSSTRGINGGGAQPGIQNVLDFITISTESNSTDFGDLTSARRDIGALSNQTRGMWTGGNPGSSPNATDTIDFVTIATLGDASDFGNLTASMKEVQSASSPTRGIMGGGSTVPASVNTIQFITIASAGNASDFGDLTRTAASLGAVSNGTRGVFANGGSNTIDFVTIASAGNALDFGDSTLLRAQCTATMSNSIRGVFAGGYQPSPNSTDTNTVDFIEIATTGNASDFGDISRDNNDSNRENGGCSDSHGGLS